MQNAMGKHTSKTDEGFLARFTAHWRFNAFVGIVLGFSVVGFYFAVETGKSRHELQRLREQNRVLKSQVTSLGQSFGAIKQYAQTVKSIASAEPAVAIPSQSDELSLVVKEPDNLGMFGRLMLTGHVALASNSDQSATESDTETFSEMVRSLENINGQAESVARRLRSLAMILKDNEAISRNIPSLKPANGRITSSFGMRLSPFDGARQMHAGIDIAAAKGSPIRSPADGTVTFVGDFDSLGNTIVIDHGSGVLTRYGHTQKANVKVGAAVKRGQVIGTVGNTGNSTGPHLHYEVWVKNNPVNPLDFFVDRERSAPLLSKQGAFRNAMGGGGSY